MVEFQLVLQFIICSSTIALLVSILKRVNKPKTRHPPSPHGLPIIGHLHLLDPLIHRSFHKLSSKWGPLIRLRLGSVPCVVVSSPDLAEEFLKTNELTFSARKQSSAIKCLTYDSSFAFAPYGSYWKFIKKIFTSELLSVSSMNQFRPMRNLELTGFIKQLSVQAKSGESVNLTSELLRLSNNVISQMMLGIRCSGTASEADDARSLVREVTKIFGEFNVSDFIWFFRNMDLQGFRKRYEDTHRRYDALLENIIWRHEQVRGVNAENNPEARDLLDMLLDVAEDENAEVKLTREHIKAIVLDFLTAATDTSAISMEWAMAELIRNPEVLEKAKDEIDNVVGKNRLVLEQDGPNLKYTQAIIKETLRLHPPIPMLIRKSVQESTVSGYNIPTGTLLFVNIWAIGRDQKYWDNPMEFRPERFLQPDPEGPIDIKGRHFQLLPFGTGRRGCPGQALAMQQLVTVVAAMIQCFDWNVVGGSEALDMTEQSGLTAPRANDLVCVPVPRSQHIEI